MPDEDEPALRILNAKESRLSEDDIRTTAEIEIHPEIRRWDTDIHTDDVKENYRLFKRFFEKLPENENQEALIAKIEDRVVGFLGIHRLSRRMRHVGDVGIMIHPDYQRKGIGTRLLKAAVKLASMKGYRRLETDTLATNLAMRRLAQKAGFKLEGVRKMRIRKDNQYLDEALMAMTLK